MPKFEHYQNHCMRLFEQNKCLIINDLSSSLNCSSRSIQRILKKIGYYSSFTHNSKWYTLQTIPTFNTKGLWFYNNIGFSQHGNLKQTILYFVNKSSKGLTAKEIAEIISMPCHPVLNQMYKKEQVDRINTKSGFVYLSMDETKKERQTDQIVESKQYRLPSDADAVKILVELIKHPDYTLDELCLSLMEKGTICDRDAIERLLLRHDLGKKTAEPPKRFF